MSRMTTRWWIVVAAVCASGGVAAQDAGQLSCGVASTYDLTIRTDALLFERPEVAPRSVRMHDGSLATDGRAVTLRPDEQDRVALFERNIRALVPKAKAIASDGVDVAARAVREEAGRASPGSLSSGELDQALASRVDD